MFTIGILKSQPEDFKSAISSRLSRDLYEQIAEIVSRLAEIEHRKSKKRQVFKFYRHEEKTNANGNKTPSNPLQDRWVFNKSDRDLSSDEFLLLC